MAERVSLLNESSDSEVEFSINKNYAEKYDFWRNKEEMQKLKDLSKDISDTSSSESEEEEAPVVEKDFLKTLSLLKSKDPKIYNQDMEFFKEEVPQKKPKAKKEKPMFMKDYERKLVLERNGNFSDEEGDDCLTKTTHTEELDEITKSFKTEDSDAGSGDETKNSGLGGLFQIRKKTKEEEEQEEEEHLQWLKGQKKEIDKDTEKDMSFLRKFWNDPNLDESEKFLRDYLLNHRYKEKDKSGEIPSYDEITEDPEALFEDEKNLEQQEMFEHKYNFRFEEPDQEFIKRYPRTVGESLRRADTRRKVKRDEYTERKKKEKEQKQEELKRLKALKRKEIEDKFFKLKETIGKDELNFDENDIDSDFDPDKHDEKMNQLFNDDYYAEEEEQKPEFLYDEEIDDENWDHWTREQAANTVSENTLQNRNEGENDSSSANEDTQVIDKKVQFEQEMVDSTHTGRKKGRKKSLFAKIVAQPKPLYDPSGKSFEDYLDEYYKLDCEDVIGDLPVRFKYRKVIPNDFGLTVKEILSANDKELNRWCSVKKTCQYRRDEEEKYDIQAFKRKAENIIVKQKVLASVYAPPDEEVELSTNVPSNNVGDSKCKRKRSKKKKKFISENGNENDTQDNTTGNDHVSLLENDTKILKQHCIEDDDVSERKKKRKKNSELTDDTLYTTHENTNDNALQENSTQDANGNAGNLDLNTTSESNWSKKKKKKKKTASESTNETSRTNIPSSTTNNVEENNALSNKSKRRNRKRKSKNSLEDRIKHYISTGKDHHQNLENAKRLEVSDERLAAFGINPKKFKSSIIYSKK